MTTIEDKIRLFSKVIYDGIREEKQAEFDDFDVERATRISELKKELEEKKQLELKEVMKKAKIKSIELVSKEKTRVQQEELKLREKMMQQIIDSLTNEINNYVVTENYKISLLKAIKKAVTTINDNICTLYLAKRDFDKVIMDLQADISYSSITVDMKVANSNILGGFLIEDKHNKYRIDHSFQSRLQDLKGYIGLRISESLK